MQATPFFDKLVFSKVKARLGGRVKLIVSGGAPLAGHVEEFLKVTMCAPVVQVRMYPSSKKKSPFTQQETPSHTQEAPVGTQLKWSDIKSSILA